MESMRDFSESHAFGSCPAYPESISHVVSFLRKVRGIGSMNGDSDGFCTADVKWLIR